MKQGGRILLKVLGCLAAAFVILFAGAVTAFITAFMGGRNFTRRSRWRWPVYLFCL